MRYKSHLTSRQFYRVEISFKLTSNIIWQLEHVCFLINFWSFRILIKQTNKLNIKSLILLMNHVTSIDINSNRYFISFISILNYIRYFPISYESIINSWIIKLQQSLIKKNKILTLKWNNDTLTLTNRFNLR